MMPNEFSDTMSHMVENPDLGPALAEAGAVLREYGRVIEHLGGEEPFAAQVTDSADITEYTMPEQGDGAGGER